MFNIGEIVWFQAYEDTDPIEGKIISKGTLSELNRLNIGENDSIFYELETLYRKPNFVFTCTTDKWIKKVEKRLVPTIGYILPLWGEGQYRATAMAYMEQKHINKVKHKNGNVYTRREIENAMINGLV